MSPQTRIRLEVKSILLKHRARRAWTLMTSVFSKLPSRVRKAMASATGTIVFVAIALSVVLSGQGTATAVTVTLAKNDIAQGSAPFGQIAKGDTSIQLQKGVVGSWGNNTGLQTLPSMSNSTTTLAYGPNDTLFLMNSFSTTCRLQKYDVERSNWEPLRSPPVGCGVGHTLSWDKANSLYFAAGSSSNRFFRYDIDTDTWTELSNFPTNVGEISSAQYVSQGSNKYLYMFRGLSSPTFWRYVVATDKWESMAPFPTGSNVNNGIPMTWDGADSIYALSNDVGEFRKYSLSNNTWTNLTSVANSCQRNGLQYTGGRIIVMRLYWCNEYVSTRAYTVATSTWADLAPAPSPATLYDFAPPIGFDGSRYIYTIYGTEMRPDIYRFDTTTNSWDQSSLLTANVDSTGYHYKTIYDGAGAAYYVGSTYGGNFDRIYKYDLATKTATRVGSQINTLSGLSGAFYNGAIYFLPNTGQVTFQKYDVTTNAFTPLADLPFATQGGLDAVDGGDGNLYVSLGSRTNFYRYNYAANTWTALTGIPQTPGNGAALSRIGTKIFLLVGAQSGYMLQYDIAANNWTYINGMPSGGIDQGSFLTSDNSRYLYAGLSSRTDVTARKVYRYDTQTLAWQRLASTPEVTKPWANAFYDTTNNKLYVNQGQNSSQIWDWTPSNDNFVKNGTWYSKTYDLKQVQAWTSLQTTITGTGTTSISTRTSDNGRIWSNWQTTTGTIINSTPRRYLQIKVNLSSDGTTSPIVSDIKVNHTQETNAPSLPSTFSAQGEKGGAVLTSGQTSEYRHPYFSWQPSSDGANGAGVAGYYVYFGADSNADPATEGSFQTTTDYTVTSPMNAGDITYLRIKVKDNLGNTSSPATFFSYRYFYVSPPGQIVQTSTADFQNGENVNVNTANGSMSLVKKNDGAWTTGPMSMLPETVRGPAATVIGDFMYVARGAGSTTFWRYNLVNQTWDTMAPVPGAVNTGSSIAYDGTNSLYMLRGNATNSFYKYDIQNNTWSTLVNLPSNSQAGSDIKYLGNNTFAVMFTGVREFYFFDSVTGLFTAKSSYPSSISDAGSGLWYDGADTVYAYMGATNWNNDRARFAMAKYSIMNDSWRTLSMAPVQSTYTQNNLVGDGRGNLYIFANNLSDNMNRNQRAMKYVIATDSWEEIRGFNAQNLWGSLTSDNSRYLYIFPSEDGNSRRVIRYDTVDNQFTPNTFGIDSLDRVPWDSHTNAYQWMGGNASAATYDGSKWVYALSQNESNFSRFVRFDPKSGETQYMPPPMYIGLGGSLSYVGGKLYYLPGRSLKEFYQFDEVAQQWNRMTDMPVVAYRPGPSTSTVIGSNIYVLAGNGRSFYRFTPNATTGTWTKMADTPANVLNGAATYDAANGYLYVVAANNTNQFFRYNVTGDAWTTQANLPTATTYGSTAVVKDGKIYVQRGTLTATSYVYDIGSNTWATTADAPDVFRYGSQVVDMGSYALAFGGEANPNLWQFNYPSANTAYNGLGVHVSKPFEIAGIFDYADITAKANVPANTKVELYTRTSIDGNNWDAWTIASDIKVSPTSVTGRIASSIKKNIQVKVVLTSLDNVSTPTVDSYAIDYYFDVDPPANPGTLDVYTDSTKTNTVQNTTWYNHAKPLFDWPDPGQPGGATDGPLGSRIAGYWVYLGTDPNASPRTAGTFVPTSEYVPDLTASGTYYLRMQTQDYAGNIDGAIFSPFVYKFDNEGPTNPTLITVTPAGFTTKNNFSFLWPAAYDANSGVAGYCYHTGATSGAFAAEVCQTGRDLLDVSAAYQSGTNVFYLRTYDTAGNFSPSYTTVSFYYSTDPPGPVTNLRAIPPSSPNNMFTFTWDLPALYSGDPEQMDYCYSVNALPTALNTTCTNERFVPAFKAATQQGTNVLYMVARDEAKNADWTSFALTNFIANTVSPGIPLNLVGSDTSDRNSKRWALTVTWDAPVFTGNGIDRYIIERSEDGNKFKEIGGTSSLAYVDLAVVPNTTYYYRVRAADGVDNRGGPSGAISMAPRGNFSEPPAIVVAPSATADSNQARINWATSRAATSFVYYGTSPGDLSQSKGALDLATDHTQLVTGLQPSTTYFYRIQSFDNERSYALTDSYSQVFSFRTNEAARMFNVTSDQPTVSSVVLSWQSSVPTKARIEFGDTGTYGRSAGDVDEFSSNHVYKLTGLSGGTTYHFRIVAQTEFGSYIYSDDYTFSTLARPVVSGVRFQSIDDQTSAGVEVSWQTNVPTSSTVKYNALGVSLEKSLSELTTDHSIIIGDLASSSDYNFVVEGRDQYGNLATSENHVWRSSVDTRAPVISDVSISVTTVNGSGGPKAQMIVIWTTDEPSTTEVNYGTYASGKLDNAAPIDTEPTTNHIAIISNLNLTDIYQVQFSSKDLSGNVVYSAKTMVVTPDKEESLLDSTLNLLLKVFRF